MYSFETVDLRDLVDDTVSELEALAQQKSQRINHQVSSQPISVRVDAARIAQVLRNLLGNAIKFAPEGSEIRLEAVGDANGAVTVSVSDEGPGIPEEQLESIFDKFIQSTITKTGAGGSGLGLAICQEIVVGHGGAIRARNNAHSGVTVSFTLNGSPPQATLHAR